MAKRNHGTIERMMKTISDDLMDTDQNGYFQNIVSDDDLLALLGSVLKRLARTPKSLSKAMYVFAKQVTIGAATQMFKDFGLDSLQNGHEFWLPILHRGEEIFEKGLANGKSK